MVSPLVTIPPSQEAGHRPPASTLPSALDPLVALLGGHASAAIEGGTGGVGVENLEAVGLVGRPGDQLVEVKILTRCVGPLAGGGCLQGAPQVSLRVDTGHERLQLLDEAERRVPPDAAVELEAPRSLGDDRNEVLDRIAGDGMVG